MIDYTIEWHTTPTLTPSDQAYSCRQVYVWLLTEDHKLVIVSKDGKKWQLPGGKPEQQETHVQTAIREVSEETGLDISADSDNLQFFGYQVVTEVGQATPPYLQIRFALRVDALANDLSLRVDTEDTIQAEQDIIKYVKAVPIADIISYIPWLEGSPELAAFRNIVTIK